MSEGLSSSNEVVIDYQGDFRLRISAESPQKAAEAFEAVVTQVQDAQREDDRRRIRLKFFAVAHVFVMVTAVLALAGMTAHFLNYRAFNTAILTTLGAWIVGAIAYIYCLVVKDAFGIKARIPPPPGGEPDEGV